MCHKRKPLGVCAAEDFEAKWVGKKPNSALLLRTLAVATAGKTALKWDFSPLVAVDALLPRRLLDRAQCMHRQKLHERGTVPKVKAAMR